MNANPSRPPDGTYTYAVSNGSGPAVLTSEVVVKSRGPTFDVSESVKLPSGETATTLVTWDAATLLPIQYALHQGTVGLEAPISTTAATFTGPPLTKPVTFGALLGTKYVLVSEGLNGLRLMLPFVIGAHPGDFFTVVQINGNRAVEGRPSTETPPTGGPAGDAATSYSIGDEQITAWYDPKTNVVDREIARPGSSRMQLVKYSPP